MNPGRRKFLLATTALAVVIGMTVVVRIREDRPLAPPTDGAPLSTPTRAEVLALAERYLTHQWTPEARHAFHGLDEAGVRIDTPDAGFKNGWRIGVLQTGLPYKWGGFDTPDTFDEGLRAGKFAGDAYTAEKRRLLDDAVSESTVGIDCSGFVSRCWGPPRSYSTRELPRLCDPVPDPAQWRPGDILNAHNNHVRLFAGWDDEARGRAHFYEASTSLRRKIYDVHEMTREGYRAWRYRGIVGE